MSWYSIAAALLLQAGASPEPPSIPICSEPTQDEQDAVAELGRWVRSARLRVMACSQDEPPPWLAFVERGGVVVLRYRCAPSSREREVPWLDRAESPLSRLRARGALARFALVLEALLTEDALERPGDEPGAPTTVAAELSQPTAPSTRTPAAEPRRAEPSTAEPPPPSPAPLEPTVVAEPSPAPDPSTTLAAGGASPAGELSSRSPIALEAFADWRVRSPGLSLFEVGGGLRWGFLGLAGSYQPPVQWSLGGRPIELAGGGAALGVHLAFWEVTRWRVGLLAHLVVEYLTLRRKDLDGAQTYAVWDVGASAGLFASVGVGPLRLEARLEGLVLPTGREVVIPDGPQAPLNRFGLRLTTALSWESSAR